MITGTCVCTNGDFTLSDEYELIFGNEHYKGKVLTRSDEGWIYILDYQGDDYYGCIDENGKEVSFLVEWRFLLKNKSTDGLY